MESYHFLDGDGTCWQCGRKFPITAEHIRSADEHMAEHPGFRRVHSKCPVAEHNYGDVAVFPGDCEYGS